MATLLLFAPLLHAQAPPSPKETPGKIAVEITDKSYDPIGKLLVKEIRGMVMQAKNLRPAAGSEPRIGLIVLTVDPKSDPGHAGSLYSIVWVSFHRTGPGVFQPLFLNSKVGVCREDQVKLVADKAMEDTQRVIGELYKSLQGK